MCSSQREDLPRYREFWLAELAHDVRDGTSGQAGELTKRFDIFPWKSDRKATDLKFASYHACPPAMGIASVWSYAARVYQKRLRRPAQASALLLAPNHDSTRRRLKGQHDGRSRTLAALTYDAI
jgi:hypothetical protein